MVGKPTPTRWYETGPAPRPEPAVIDTGFGPPSSIARPPTIDLSPPPPPSIARPPAQPLPTTGRVSVTEQAAPETGTGWAEGFKSVTDALVPVASVGLQYQADRNARKLAQKEGSLAEQTAAQRAATAARQAEVERLRQQNLMSGGSNTTYLLVGGGIVAAVLVFALARKKK